MILLSSRCRILKYILAGFSLFRTHLKVRFIVFFSLLFAVDQLML